MAAFDPKDIRIPREPTVYLLGRQSIDPGELARFLTYQFVPLPEGTFEATTPHRKV